MNKYFKKMLKNYKENGARVVESSTALIQDYIGAIEFLMEKGLYHEFLNFLAKKAEDRLVELQMDKIISDDLVDKDLVEE